jgi:uncharacterized membrane protein YphA (DoxX/SURF4 family)
LPGLGILLLRVAVGLIAIAQGIDYLSDDNLTASAWITGLLMILSGMAILIGFLTPVAGVLVALATLGFMFSWFRSPSVNLFETRLTTVLMVTVTAAIVFIGPGALSLDARLFGRREIIIPSSSRLPKP